MTTTKPRSPKKAARSITIDSVRDAIAALRRDDYPPKLNASVRDLLFAAERVRDSAIKLRETLLAKSRLSAELLDSFELRIQALDEYERAWQSVRSHGVSVDLSRARKAATDLRADAVSTLRHFLEDLGPVQNQLDAIVEGDGDVDLIDDLKKLADLVDEHWDRIAESDDLPAERGDALRKSAATLNDARLGSEASPEARRAIELRDKAFFYLLDAEREIRACGKHAFRKEPSVAGLFADMLFGGRSTPTKAEPANDPTKPA